MKHILMTISAFLFATVLMGVDGCSKKEEATETPAAEEPMMQEEANIVEGEDQATPEAMEQDAAEAMDEADSAAESMEEQPQGDDSAE